LGVRGGTHSAARLGGAGLERLGGTAGQIGAPAQRKPEVPLRQRAPSGVRGGAQGAARLGGCTGGVAGFSPQRG